MLKPCFNFDFTWISLWLLSETTTMNKIDCFEATWAWCNSLHLCNVLHHLNFSHHNWNAGWQKAEFKFFSFKKFCSTCYCQLRSLKVRSYSQWNFFFFKTADKQWKTEKTCVKDIYAKLLDAWLNPNSTLSSCTEHPDVGWFQQGSWHVYNMLQKKTTAGTRQKTDAQIIQREKGRKSSPNAKTSE